MTVSRIAIRNCATTKDLRTPRYHLTEADLAAARIAAANNISLQQWIIECRLEGARTDLVSPAGGPGRSSQ
jgi:hypothetical protein